jgi:hypothetical protein
MALVVAGAANAAEWIRTSGDSAGLQRQGKIAEVGRLAPNTGPPLGIDPDVEPGFPVQAYRTSGSYYAGQGIHALVGNIDADPTLEILASALASGPLYAWNADGSPQPGWPAGLGVAYPGLGELSDSFPGLEVFAAEGRRLVAYSGAGQILPGWPRSIAVSAASPPTLIDVDGDVRDEIFVEGGYRFELNGYRAEGSVLPGWPPGGGGMTAAAGDLDGDGVPEIVTATRGDSSGTWLFAYHRNGSRVAGFPVHFESPSGYVHTFPAIGDVDGDGALEIVVVVRAGATIAVVAANGTVERTMGAPGEISYGTAPALGDLDGDGVPEIVVQTNDSLDVWKGDGTHFPGWPQTWSDTWIGNSSPVIGDVDGDELPDIALVTQVAGSSVNGEVRLYSRNGVLHPHFPKPLPIGPGGVPAIADIDLDGRNELVVLGSAWTGQSGWYDKVWAYDLHGTTYGSIEWGQLGGGAQHRGCYGCPPTPPPPPPPPPPPMTCTGGQISIQDFGAGIPYPSTCVVSGLSGTITDVNITINGFTHTYPDDIDILLASPTPSTNAVVMSDAGGSVDLSGANFTLDDEAATQLPDLQWIENGSYRPANHQPPDFFYSPAPTQSGNVSMSTFDGVAPNGTWNLWLMDDSGEDAGDIGGWSLNITTNGGPPPPPPPRPPPPPPPPPAPPPPPPPPPPLPPPPPSPPPPAPPPPPPARCRVPRVIGFRLGQARQRIRRANCSVGRVRRAHSRRVGRVIGQSPRPGAVRRGGFPLRLVVGRR